MPVVLVCVRSAPLHRGAAYVTLESGLLLPLAGCHSCVQVNSRSRTGFRIRSKHARIQCPEHCRRASLTRTQTEHRPKMQPACQGAGALRLLPHRHHLQPCLPVCCATSCFAGRLAQFRCGQRSMLTCLWSRERDKQQMPASTGSPVCKQSCEHRWFQPYS